MTDLEKLKRAHEAYNAKLRERGVTLLRYVVPCCGATLEDRAANPGETWDTLATCPECGAMFWKVSTAARITASVPAA